MKWKDTLPVLLGVLLAASLLLAVVGCTGETEPTAGVLPAGSTSSTALTPVTPAETTVAQVMLPGDELSTFESKDPFIQQVTESADTTTNGSTPTTLGPGTTINTGSTSNTSTTYYTTTTRYTSTTRYPNTSTTWWTSTTRPPSTTTTTKPPSTTTTTAPHVHTLKILSVDVSSGSATVTFRVDNSIYKNRVVGDSVSTSWGQVQVVDIAGSSKVVTLLHAGEQVVLEPGQQIYE